MKKFLRGLAAFICVTAIFLSGCETEDGGICLAWSVSCLAVALLSGLVFNRMLKEDEGR